MTRVLVVDDDAALRALFADELPRRGFQVATAPSGEAALALLEGEPVDVVLTDVNMRGMSGVQLAERVVASRPSVPVVLMTAFGDLETAIRAIRAGAYDFLTKPVDVDQLALALRRAARQRELTIEVERLRTLVDRSAVLGEFVTESAAMAPVLELVRRVAPTSTTVLIRGESGTGKELVARALHRLGARPQGPFTAVNCAAIPEALLESELFGHARGAFTGAVGSRRGLFLEASGGTLFLDEIGELPQALQAKLLRALEQRTVRPVGGSKEEPFDARIVAATNRNLLAEAQAGRFREDLYYRLAVIEVDVPPLRARGSDVLLLAQHMIEKHARALGKPVRRLSVAAADRLLAYAFPGNVRELENAIVRAVTLARETEVVPADLPPSIRDGAPRAAGGDAILPPGEDISSLPTLAEVEDRYIRKVVGAVGGNKTLAAKVLGLDRKTLYRKLGPGDGEGPSPRAQGG